MKRNVFYGLIAVLLAVLGGFALLECGTGIRGVSILLSTIGEIAVAIHFWRIVFNDLADAIRLIRSRKEH